MKEFAALGRWVALGFIMALWLAIMTDSPRLFGVAFIIAQSYLMVMVWSRVRGLWSGNE